MATGVVPQIFAIWRKSVLFTVGAISLGAERLEQQIARILKPVDRDRRPRVKVPVRGTRTTAPAVTRRARAVRKTAVARAAKSVRAGRKVAVRTPRVKAAAPAALVETTAANQ